LENDRQYRNIIHFKSGKKRGANSFLERIAKVVLAFFPFIVILRRNKRNGQHARSSRRTLVAEGELDSRRPRAPARRPFSGRRDATWKERDCA
jgi:hypothetical protein